MRLVAQEKLRPAADGHLRGAPCLPPPGAFSGLFASRGTGKGLAGRLFDPSAAVRLANVPQRVPGF